MCYPDLEEVNVSFVKAFKQFKIDLNQVLLLDLPMSERYKRIYKNEQSKMCYIYLQTKTNSIVKVCIDASTDFNPGDIPIELFAEDHSILKQLENLDSVIEMRRCMEIIKDVITEDRTLVKLKYNI